MQLISFFLTHISFLSLSLRLPFSTSLPLSIHRTLPFPLSILTEQLHPYNWHYLGTEY